MAVAEERTYTSQEVADLVGMPKRRLTDLARQGVLQPQREGGRDSDRRRFRWTKKDLEAAHAAASAWRKPVFEARAREAVAAEPMTLGQAVEVLNREGHRGVATWYSHRFCPAASEVVIGDGPEDDLTPFEAIAIAEKYERDGGK